MTIWICRWQMNMLVTSQYQPRLSSITKIFSRRINQSDWNFQIKLNYFNIFWPVPDFSYKILLIQRTNHIKYDCSIHPLTRLLLPKAAYLVRPDFRSTEIVRYSGMIFFSYLTDFSYLPLERNCRKLVNTVRTDHKWTTTVRTDHKWTTLKGGVDGFSYFSLIFNYFIF